MYHKLLTETFPTVHGESSVVENPLGFTYPVVVERFICTKKEQINLILTTDNRHFVNDETYLQQLLGERKSWNGKTVVLRKLVIEGDVNLHISDGFYYDTLVSSGYLKDEFKALTKNDKQLIQSLPYRHAIYSSVSTCKQQVWSAEGLSAALSVSTAFLVYDGREYKVAYFKRSEHVAEDAGVYHLLPSMLLQPEDNLEKTPGYQVILNMVLQEIDEEVFSTAEKTAADGKRSEASAELLQLLENNEAEFTLTGLATDLVSLRPEIMSVLIVDNPDWFNKHKKSIHICEFEFDTAEHVKQTLFHSININKLFLPPAPFMPDGCVPTAAASLIEGLNYLNSTRLNRTEPLFTYT